MTTGNTEGKRYEGIPMSEESLKEWKQSFADIEESISSVMKGEDDDDNRRHGRQICKEGGKEGNA